MLFIESKTTQLIGYYNHNTKLKMSHDDYTYIIIKREGLLPFKISRVMMQECCVMMFVSEVVDMTKS